MMISQFSLCYIVILFTYSMVLYFIYILYCKISIYLSCNEVLEIRSSLKVVDMYELISYHI